MLNTLDLSLVNFLFLKRYSRSQIQKTYQTILKCTSIGRSTTLRYISWARLTNELTRLRSIGSQLSKVLVVVMVVVVVLLLLLLSLLFLFLLLLLLVSLVKIVSTRNLTLKFSKKNGQ